MWFAVVAPAAAHDLRVYSEFTRIDPFGSVVHADRGADPREILSPAIPRNAATGFHVVVSGEPGESFTLHAGQNPENAVRITVYRESYTRVGDEWIPDGLTQIDVPYTAKLDEVPGQTAQAFWMDLWADGNAPVERIKVEPEAFMDGRWIRYPMEVRIVKATAPPRGAGIGLMRVDRIDLPSDASARLAFRNIFCTKHDVGEPAAAPTVRSFIARDARQDLLLAGAIDPELLWQWFSAGDRREWCSSYVPSPLGPELFLRARDRIYRAHD